MLPIQPQQPGAAPWRKVLWFEQPYPDNHTSDWFLQALVVHEGRRRRYWRVVGAALDVDQQLCAAAAVASVAHHLRTGTFSARHLLATEAFALLAGALLVAWAVPHQRIGAPCSKSAQPYGVQLLHRAAPLGATAGLLGAAAALSPVYATLTASVSSDTVVACTAALLLAHLYLHEYRREKAGGRGLAGSLGLACALCASVLMASRLRSLEQVFALVVLSLEVYIFAPALQRDLAAAAPAAAAALPAVAAALALALVSQQSVVLTSALVCALAFITLLCPMWLVRIHKFKAQINGPWDEAAPRLFSALGQQS